MGQTTVYVNGKADHVFDSGSGSSSPVPNNASQATQAQDAQAASQQVAGKISGGMLPSGGLTAPSGPTPGTANPTDGINAPGVAGNPVVPTAVQNNATGAGVGSSSLNPPASQAPAALPPAPPSKYDAGLAAAKASGNPAPSDAAGARSAVASYTPNGQPDTSGVDSLISQDPGINKLMQGIVQLLSPQKQTTSLLDDYNSLYKQSGLADINKEIIDANTVINGTEGDIRNEIQTAGGLGTDSQVQAMSLARNKSLLTRYNQLVQMKTDATNQLNTLSQLNVQDKQMAQTRVNNQIDSMFKLADFRQQAITNVKEGFNSLVAKVGYAGAYQAYSQSPQQLAAIEQTMGLASGGLKQLAAQPDLDRMVKEANIEQSKAAAANSYSEIAARKSPADKPQTQAQLVAQGYAQRATAANATISRLGGQFTDSTAIGGFLPTILQSGGRQAYEQAKREFVNSVLRPESGAAISPSEFTSASHEYFPQQGDSPAVVQQKAIDRQLKINSLQQQGKNSSVAEAGKVITYQGAQYTVDSNGDMTPI